MLKTPVFRKVSWMRLQNNRLDEMKQNGLADGRLANFSSFGAPPSHPFTPLGGTPRPQKSQDFRRLVNSPKNRCHPEPDTTVFRLVTG